MTSDDYTNIRAKKDAMAAAREAKRDDETWSGYIRRCADNPPERRDYVAADEIPSADDIAAAVVEAIGPVDPPTFADAMQGTDQPLPDHERDDAPDGERACPECGTALVEELGGNYCCLACGWQGDAV